MILLSSAVDDSGAHNQSQEDAAKYDIRGVRFAWHLFIIARWQRHLVSIRNGIVKFNTLLRVDVLLSINGIRKFVDAPGNTELNIVELLLVSCGSIKHHIVVLHEDIAKIPGILLDFLAFKKGEVALA